RVGGTHPYAGHTGHARVGFDLKVHETAGRGAAALRKTSSKGAVTWTPEHCLSIGARTTTLWWSEIRRGRTLSICGTGCARRCPGPRPPCDDYPASRATPPRS